MTYPLGISFGPTYITGAYALDDGSIVPVTRVPATMAYQNFFQQTLQKRVQDDLQSRPQEGVPDTHLFPSEFRAGELETLCIHELNAIKADSERVLGATVDVKAISIPYHWNTTVQSAISNAAQAVNNPLAGTRIFVRLPRALAKAYNIESSIAEDDYYCIVVDYNQSYLHLLICETAKNGGYALVEGQV